MAQMKRFKVRATVTAHHLISVQAVDEEAAKEAAMAKHIEGRLARQPGHMEVTSCEEWPPLPETRDPSEFIFDGD